MAKLYWRVKKNGKWTWTPVNVIDLSDEPGPKRNQIWYLLEEEE